MTPDIAIATTGGVQTIRFARPSKKNALTGEMYAALVAAIISADGDDQVGVHLFLGQPGVFTAGCPRNR